MCRRYWQAEAVCSGDCGRCCDFGTSALCVRQMRLADFLADSHDDALPADHSAEAESDRDRNLHPGRDKFRRTVERALIAVERSNVSAAESAFVAFHQQAKS